MKSRQAEKLAKQKLLEISTNPSLFQVSIVNVSRGFILAVVELNR